MVLIDLDSTHNFLDPSMVGKENFYVQNEEMVKIMVANVEEIYNEDKCPKLKFLLQGVEFLT